MCMEPVNKSKAAGWISLAMVFIAVSALLPDFVHPAGQLQKDWLDGVRGLLTGVGLGIEVMFIVYLARQRRARRG